MVAEGVWVCKGDDRMCIFGRQFFRNSFVSICLIILVCLAVCFSCIGFAAWSSARSQYTAIATGYTTTAIMKEHESTMEQEGCEQQNLLDCLETDKIPGLIQIDKRCILGAYVEGCTTLSSGTLDIMKYNEIFDRYSASYSVLAVECIEIIDDSREYQETVDPISGNLTIEIGNISYRVKFRLIDPIVRLGSYDLPPYDDTIEIHVLCNSDGIMEFEVGKNYIVRGFYHDYPIMQVLVESEHGRELQWQRIDQGQGMVDYHRRLIFSQPPLYEAMPVFDRISPDIQPDGLPNFILHQGVNDEQQTYSYTPENSQPFFTEYEGNWQDFLETAEGAVWKDEIIPTAMLNQQSATIILTDNIESMYLFNTREASILDGRYISSDEYATSAQVCLVSAAYATLNGLQVGDTISLDLYDSGYCVSTGSDGAMMSSDLVQTISRFPLIPETNIGVKQEYKIVGIYTGPEFSFGAHSFQANTIFIPKQSVPDAHLYEDSEFPLLTSFVLENGMADEFEAYMDSLGFGGMFLYFDQDYSKTVVTLEALVQNASRLFTVSILVFLLAAGVYLYLNLRRMAPAARSMRLLGQSAKTVQFEMLMILVPATFVSVLAGAFLGGGLFNSVTQSLLSDAISLDWSAIMVCAIVEMLILAIISALVTNLVAAKHLVISGRKKRR